MTGETYYLKVIADAVEALAGVSTTANASVDGYLLRIAIAFEILAGI